MQPNNNDNKLNKGDKWTVGAVAVATGLILAALVVRTSPKIVTVEQVRYVHVAVTATPSASLVPAKRLAVPSKVITPVKK